VHAGTSRAGEACFRPLLDALFFSLVEFRAAFNVWQLFDFDLEPGPAYFATKLVSSLAVRHVVFVCRPLSS